MADSSFDPLGIVKAMGPQRDPYSWAELYAADASKHKLAKEELKNRLLIEEMTRAERAKEGAATRSSHERIAGQAEAGRMSRWKDRVEGKVGGTAGKPLWVDQPPGAIPFEEYILSKRAGSGKTPIDASKYHFRQVGTQKWLVPRDPSGAPPPPAPRSGGRRDKYDEPEEED